MAIAARAVNEGPPDAGKLLRLGQDGIEAPVPGFGSALVALDPFRHEFEDLRFQMDGATLCLASFRHEAGAFEHLEVFGDRLHAHVVRFGEIADGGLPARLLLSQLGLQLLVYLPLVLPLALMLGLALTGQDGRMLSYGALVLAVAASQAWQLRKR